MVRNGSTTLGRQLSQTGSYSATVAQCQRYGPLVRHRYSAQQYGAMLLTKCSGAGDKTRRTHAVEDIICYSWLLASYRIGLYLPRGRLSGLGARCNYPNLSYKRLG
jgi:hypothetical protein